MSPFQAFVLAVIQGVAEFLPISSSAHLILMPHFFGWRDQGLIFDIATNTGSMLAVIVYFWRDLRKVCSDGVAQFKLSGRTLDQPLSLAPALVLATIPLALGGVLFSDWVSTSARNPRPIAIALVFFGLLLFAADRLAKQQNGLESLRWREVLWIGLAQALALMPGTSRSGITITAGLLLGLRREEAGRFSFLLSIPAGMMVLAYDVLKLAQDGPPNGGYLPLLIGLIVSAVASYFVIDLLLTWVRTRTFTAFVVYRILLGSFILTLPLL
jgi:undecaprenyl-diphosphatase